MGESANRWLCMGMVVLQTLIFGFGNALTKVAYSDITPLWCMVLRFGLAFAVFAALFGVRIVRQLRRAPVSSWLPAAVCMALSYVGNNVALDLTTATNVGFLVALPVVFAPILSSAVNRVRYPVAFVPLQAAVVAGLFLLCSNGGTFSFGAGELVALLSSVALAGALVFGERGLAELDAACVAGTQIAATSAVSLAFALAFEPVVDVATVTPLAWGTIAFLALASTCLTFLLQNQALARLKSSTVSLLLTGEPVFTAVFSLPMLGEALDGRGLAGAVVIVAAVACATTLEGRKGVGDGVCRAACERARLAHAAAQRAFRDRRAA